MSGSVSLRGLSLGFVHSSELGPRCSSPVDVGPGDAQGGLSQGPERTRESEQLRWQGSERSGPAQDGWKAFEPPLEGRGCLYICLCHRDPWQPSSCLAHPGLPWWQLGALSRVSGPEPLGQAVKPQGVEGHTGRD